MNEANHHPKPPDEAALPVAPCSASAIEAKVAADNEWAAKPRTKQELRKAVQRDWHNNPIEVWIEDPQGNRYPAKVFSETVPVGPFLISAIPQFNSVARETQLEVDLAEYMNSREVEKLSPLGIVGRLKLLIGNLWSTKHRGNLSAVNRPTGSIRSLLLCLFPKWCRVNSHGALYSGFLPNDEMRDGESRVTTPTTRP
jgi:hypothetical protein